MYIKKTLIFGISIFLAIGLILPLGTQAVYAEDENKEENKIVKAIDEYVAPYIDQNDLTNYNNGQASTCHAFVNYVWKNIFGKDLYNGVSKITEKIKNYDKLGLYINTYAKPGDILRVDKAHSMIITSFDEDGVTGYDWTRTTYIKKRTYTWEKVKAWGDGTQDYFLYQINDDIYEKAGGVITPVNQENVEKLKSMEDEEKPGEKPEEKTDDEITDNKPENKIVLRIGNPIMELNGEKIKIDDQDSCPLIKNSRTLLPLRAVLEQIGAEIIWDGKEKLITIKKDETTMKLKIPGKQIEINGKVFELECAPEIIKDRTFLPLRPILEALSVEITWDGEEKAVVITF